MMRQEFKIGDNITFERDKGGDRWDATIKRMPSYEICGRYGVVATDPRFPGHDLDGLSLQKLGWNVDFPETMKLVEMDTVSQALDYFALMEAKDELGLE